jgi:8-amino-7-oxononanoate synthase
MPQDPLSNQLLSLKRQGAYRHRRKLQGPQGVEVSVDGDSFISFCSNDYLGLANDPRVRSAACNAISKFGVGSGASQLISGYSSLHAELEEQLADFLGFQRCVLFSSGYLANLGVISTFSTRKSLILEDKLNHASLIDAAQYAGANLKRYRHRDTKHATEIFNSTNAESRLIVTDGVFSMEGSIAPLDQLVKLRTRESDKLIVDDAHAIGVLGKQGKGTLEYHNISPTQVDILIGTFGKSFGSSGAFVAADSDTVEFLIQKARSLIYTTSPPAALAAAAQQSLDIIISEPERRQRLQSNIKYFRACLSETNLELLDSITAIQTIIIGGNNEALIFSQRLEQLGLLVLAIRPPTVPKNTARLRITLCSEHTRKQIDLLASALLEIENSLT